MTHASLFSGIGGAEIAASMMGWENAFHCEIQEFPRRVLEYWYPNSTSYEDITKTDFTPWRGGGKSTSSQEAFLASPFLTRESERERKTTATSGRKCCERYGRYSPLGSLVKTLLESSRWYSPAVSLKWEAKTLFSERITRYGKDGSSTSSRPSAKTLNARDIPSSRLLFRLVPSARRTGGTGCGSSQGALLPTPAVMEDRRKPNGDTERQKKLMSNLNPYSIAELLPTPVTQGLKVQDGDDSMRPMPLELLPTPRASCMNPGTPKDRKDGKTRDSELNHRVAKAFGATSQLNPLFVAEMMGFPREWLTLPFLGRNGGRNQ